MPQSEPVISASTSPGPQDPSEPCLCVASASRDSPFSVLPHAYWHTKQCFSAAYRYKADASTLLGLKGENPVISLLLGQ